MKSLLIITLLFSVNSGCAKEPPNLSPTAHSQFQSDRYIKALSDFQDGVEAAYQSGWLSRADTHKVAQILGVAFVTIHETPDGAKATALAAIQEITRSVDLTKFSPYINSVKSVIEGL